MDYRFDNAAGEVCRDVMNKVNQTIIVSDN